VPSHADREDDNVDDDDDNDDDDDDVPSSNDEAATAAGPARLVIGITRPIGFLSQPSSSPPHKKIMM